MPGWARLNAYKDVPLRRFTLPATIIVPVAAVVFAWLGQSDLEEWLFPGVARSWESQFQYAPLLFWFYVASVCFLFFVVLVEAYCPETIRAHRDLESFLLHVFEAADRLSVSEVAGDTDTRVERISELRSQWLEIDGSLPWLRAVCSCLFYLSFATISFGVFIYIPAKVLQFDSLTRLFGAFFLLRE